MMLIGLLILLACGALAADLVIESTDNVSMTAFTYGFTGFTAGELFVIGAVVGILFAVGCALFAAGIGRRAERRRERRTMVTDSEEAENLRAENARLENELLAERTDGRSYPSEPATADTYDSDTTRTGGRHRLFG
jgi:hypothetical protein